MPVYLLHGFRWPRALIRIHIILQDIEEAAAEWLVGTETSEALLDNFDELFPESMLNLPNLRFIEQYDATDISAAAISQPYAYVADVVHDIKLGVDIDEVRGKGVSNEQWASLLEIRDKIAPDANVGWYVVVCDDEERYYSSLEGSDEEDEEVDAEGTPVASVFNAPQAHRRTPPMPPVPRLPGPSRTPAGSESIGYPTKMETIRPRTRNGSGSVHERNGSTDSSGQYAGSYRPRTAGSIFTSISSRTTRGTSSPDASRRDHSSPDESRSGSHGSPEVPQKGFKRILSSLKRRKSKASMRETNLPRSYSESSHDAPPVPALPRGSI